VRAEDHGVFTPQAVKESRQIVIRRHQRKGLRERSRSIFNRRAGGEKPGAEQCRSQRIYEILLQYRTESRIWAVRP